MPGSTSSCSDVCTAEWHCSWPRPPEFPAPRFGPAPGLAVVGHFSSAYLGLSEDTECWAVISPFHFYAADDPLVNGASWESVLVLGLFAVVLVAAAFPLFQRRDLRIN